MPQPKRFKSEEWFILTQKIWSATSDVFNAKENMIIQNFISEGKLKVEQVQEKKIEAPAVL